MAGLWYAGDGRREVPRVGLVLEWRPAASYAGYGTSVIRNLVPYELDGTVDYLLQI